MSAPGAIARTAGVLGHELRNPLAAAVTGTALLRELIDADDPRRQVVESVRGELERMRLLLDGYLDLMRCGRPRRLPVALERLAQTVAGRHDGVIVDIAKDAMVEGDAVLLERAIENLVENALHAGARRVRIAIRPRRLGLGVLVEDDGPGVPAEVRGRIFEPGFSRTGSTGLGLGIAAEIAAAHSGTLRCEACASGARFVIELPAPALACD